MSLLGCYNVATSGIGKFNFFLFFSFLGGLPPAGHGDGGEGGGLS
jgi:hypothetical protein